MSSSAKSEDTRYHIELRTEAYWVTPVFDVLKKHGVGLVFPIGPGCPSAEAVCQGRNGVFQFRKPGGHPAHHSSADELRGILTPRPSRLQNGPGMLDQEMIEDTAKIVNEAIKDKVQVNLIINNRAGGNAPLIAEKIAERLHSQKQQGLF